MFKYFHRKYSLGVRTINLVYRRSTHALADYAIFTALCFHVSTAFSAGAIAWMIRPTLWQL